MLAESLAAVWAGWRLFDLGAHQRALETFSFQLLLYFALFSIVSERERRAFWASRPSTTLAVALIATGVAVFVLCLIGMPGLTRVPVGLTMVAIVSAIVASLTLNDWVKAMMFRHVRVST